MTILEASCSLSRGVLAYNASKVGMLQSCLSSLESSLGTIPDLIETIDRESCWRDFKFPDSDVVHWNAAEFREFIESPRPRGCETPLYVLERAIPRGTDAWETFLRLQRGERGGVEGNPGNPHPNPFGRGGKPKETTDRDNITDSCFSPIIPLSPDVPRPRVRDYSREAPTGTSVSYTMRRLDRNAPELAQRVKAGELSPSAAATLAGFREAKITIPHNAIRAAGIIVKHMSPEQVKALIIALANAVGFPIQHD